MRRGAPTLVHVHIEDMRRGVHEHLMFGDGELDLAVALAALAEIGYDGLVAVELSRHAHAAHETVPRAIALLRGGEREEVTIVSDRSRAVDARSRSARRPRGWRGCARRRRGGRGRRRPRSASRFPMAGRKVGREPLDPDADAGDVHAWTIDDAARTLLLVALGDAASRPSWPSCTASATPPSAAACCARCRTCRSATAALALVDDAIRTNDTRLIAAALGPYATEHLDDAAYDQAVLKCVFVGVPIAPLDGLPGARDAETARGCSPRSCTSASPPAATSPPRSGP